MNAKEIIKSISSDNEEYIVLSKVYDKMIECENKNIAVSTKFMDSHMQSLSKQLLTKLGCRNYVFDGGNDDAERRLCIFLPDYPTDIDAMKYIRARKSKRDNLTHRDYLGSLMGLQITRECIGDIFVNENGADIIVVSEIAEYIMAEYRKAGRKQLELSYIKRDDIDTGEKTFEIKRVSVSSMRLDVVIASCFNVSRGKSLEIIQSGKAVLNNTECLKNDKNVDIGDKVNIRGKGKIVIENILGTSKRGKFVLEIKKY